MSEPDLQRLIERGQKAQAEQQRLQDTMVDRELAVACDEREQMLDRALGNLELWTLACVMVPQLVIPLVVVVWAVRGGLHLAVIAGALALSISVAVGGGPLLARVQRRREERWLRQRPYPIEVRGYLIALGEERHAATLAVTLTFGTTLSEESRQRARDAALGLAPDGQAKWIAENILAIKSPAIATSTPRSRSKRDRYSNRPAHLWFKRIASGLQALEAIAPLSSVKVEVL